MKKQDLIKIIREQISLQNKLPWYKNYWEPGTLIKIIKANYKGKNYDGIRGRLVSSMPPNNNHSVDWALDILLDSGKRIPFIENSFQIERI